MNIDNKLCLCMIVKDERPILEDCFNSVIDSIDYWIICDTGSTDGTQQFINEYFESKNIKGELYEDEWLNFAHNRTLAFERAKNKAKYCYVIDADDRLEGNILIPPGEDIINFMLKINLGPIEYYRAQIFRNDLDWIFKGVVHEYACLKNPNIPGKHNVYLDDCKVNAGTFGNRTTKDNKKFCRDIELLLKGIEDEEKNSRYYFYLAQSYKDIGNYKKAIKWYNKRINLGGWEEEIYCSKYYIAYCKQRDNYDFDNEILFDYLDSFNYREIRLEPLYQIMMHYKSKDELYTAFSYGMLGYNINFPKDDILFIEKDIYNLRFWYVLSYISYKLGFKNLAYKLITKTSNDSLCDTKNCIPCSEIFEFKSKLLNEKI